MATTSSSQPSKSSHSMRNDLIALTAAIVVIVVLVAAFYTILPSLFSQSPRLLYRSAPAPTGIADYGLTIDSGKSSTQRVAAKQVTALVTINDINASNPTVEPSSNSRLVTLQMNLCLLVNSTRGTQVYWLQNIAFLYTEIAPETGHAPPFSHYVNFNNEIDNFSARPSSLDNSTILGAAGWIFRAPYPHYASGSPNGNYFSFPFAFSFFTNESLVPDGVKIMMGYQFSQGVRNAATSKNIYDTIFIKIAGVTGAALEVDGRHLTPIGNYLDAELVFAGPPGGYSTHFASMDSTLALEYTTLDGRFARPHSVWEFGSDTGERADNLQTNFDNGNLTVTVGKLDLSHNYRLG